MNFSFGTCWLAPDRNVFFIEFLPDLKTYKLLMVRDNPGVQFENLLFRRGFAAPEFFLSLFVPYNLTKKCSLKLKLYSPSIFWQIRIISNNVRLHFSQVWSHHQLVHINLHEKCIPIIKTAIYCWYSIFSVIIACLEGSVGKMLLEAICHAPQYFVHI